MVGELAELIVAARAAGRPSFSLAAIDRELRGAPSPLDRFSALDMRAVLSWSYRAPDSGWKWVDLRPKVRTTGCRM
jgi:hypothetical protein